MLTLTTTIVIRLNVTLCFAVEYTILYPIDSDYSIKRVESEILKLNTFCAKSHHFFVMAFFYIVMLKLFQDD